MTTCSPSEACQKVAISNSTRRIAGIGVETQSRTVSISAPISRMIAITNHTLSGTNAAAVMRCSHQCSTPSFAEPRPSARPSGERIRLVIISVDPVDDRGDPGDHCQHCRSANHEPAAEIGRLEVKRLPGIPDQMPDAIAQVIEQPCGPAEQQQQPNP